MNKIGILSGRVVPENYERYQVFPQNWELDITKARDIGFEFVELVYDADGEVMELLDHADRFREEKVGLSADSLCVAALTSIPLLDSKRRADILKDSFSLAKELSINMIVIPLLEEHAPATLVDMERILVELVSLADATSYSGCLALESDFDSFDLKSSLEKLEIQQQVGLCLDTGNICFLGKNPAEEILAAGDALFHVHLKDRTFGGENCKPGDGDADFRSIFHMLKKVNYEGLCALETPYGNEACQSAEENLSYFKRIWTR